MATHHRIIIDKMGKRVIDLKKDASGGGNSSGSEEENDSNEENPADKEVGSKKDKNLKNDEIKQAENKKKRRKS